MKIIHTADIHIGVENYGRPATEADIEGLPDYFSPGIDRAEYIGFSTRLLDFLSTFDFMVNYALENDVDLFILAGDAYKARNPSQTHQREFARRISRLVNDGGIPVFSVIGNHDSPQMAGRATSLEIFPTLAANNVYIADQLRTYIVPTRTSEVQLIALPWIKRAAFLAREETKDLGMEQVTQLLEDRINKLLDKEISGLSNKLPSILCGHITVSSASAGSERNMMLGKDHTMLLGKLANPIFDYVALGHIHKHQILSYHPMVTYSGSIQRIDFSEEKEEKGFCVVDLDATMPSGNRLKSFHFQKVDARSFQTVDVEVNNDEDPTQKTEAAILNRSLENAIVRLRISMPKHSLSSFNEPAIRESLNNTHQLSINITLTDKTRSIRLDLESSKNTSPMNLLTTYLESRNLSPSQMSTLSDYAQKLINEGNESNES